MSDFFVKKDSGYYTAQDIYDNRGMLLLSRGKKITNEIKNKLERIGKHHPERSTAAGDKQSVVLTPAAREFAERISIRDNRILEKPNKVLINIIFESKTKPWWIHVNALSNYVDWLYTHSIDVAMISLMMAVKLEYSDKELLNIGLGAFLHDAGKLLIPKPILQKPGTLNDMEMEVMRQHCELGLSSLEPFHLQKECTDIILQHHERLDGSGYPKALKGDEICRDAQIVMIADAVDAITSGRPYKSAQEINEAITIIRSDKGKYNQEFVTLLEKILE